MHNCVRCGRASASLEEINQGCPCGSKVFVFNKEAVQNSAEQEKKMEQAASSPAPQSPLQQYEMPAQPMPSASEEPKAAPQSPHAEKKEEAGGGKAPESYFARTTFTSEDVENIKILREGVFLVDIKALSNNPVVLKDEEGIYYVKLPFEDSGKIRGKPIGDGNGKNEGF